MQVIDVTRTSEASRGDVWLLLGDSRTWPEWTPIEEHTELEAAGDDGTGEVRLFKTGRVTVRERVVESRPRERFSYVLLAGLAVKDYRAVIDLSDSGDGGTEIHWHTTFRAKVPGTGWLYRRALQRATEQFAGGLAREAGRQP